MKRSWFGAALLLILLASAALVTWSMEEIHKPVVRDLSLAAGCALSGDWESADTLVGEAGAQWRKWSHFRGCFADHGPVEDIDSGFAQLGAYCREQEAGDFAAMCKELSRRVEAVSQAHSLTWWNVM